MKKGIKWIVLAVILVVFITVSFLAWEQFKEYTKLLKKSEQGDADAQLKLGGMYKEGKGAHFVNNHLQNKTDRKTQVGDVIWHVNWVDKQAKKEKTIWPGIMDPTKSLFEYEIDKRLLGETFALPTFVVGDIFLIRIVVQESGGMPIRLEVVNNETKDTIKVLMDEVIPKPKEHGGGTGYLRGWLVEPGTYPASVSIRLKVGTVIKEQILHHQHRDDINALSNERLGLSNGEKAASELEILDTSYSAQILIDGTDPIGDVAVDPINSDLFCVQHMHEVVWRVCKLVDGKLEEKYIAGLTFSRDKIEISPDNKMYIYTDDRKNFTIRSYDLKNDEGPPVLDLSISKSKEDDGHIIDFSISPLDGKLYLTSFLGIKYCLDLKARSINPEKNLTGISRMGWDRDGNICVFHGEYKNLDFYNEFYVSWPLSRHKLLLLNVTKATREGSFAYKDVKYNQYEKNFILFGTLYTAGQDKDIVTDYVLKVDLTNGRLVPIVRTTEGKGFSIGGIDLDRNGNIFLSHNVKAKGKNRGSIIRLIGKTRLDTE